MALTRVNTKHPCPICGKPSWCSYDDNKILCARITDNADRIAADGSGIFITDHKTREELRATVPCPAPSITSTLEYQVIHNIYGGMLAASPVPSTHPLVTDSTKGLGVRGFTRFEQFGLLPGRKEERTFLLSSVLSALRLTNPAGVPGVWHSGVEWRLGSPYHQKDALMIPVRAQDGEIRGIQLRFPTKDKDKRYRWLSSAKLHRGVPGVAHVHYIWPETTETKILVTEGALKAEVLRLFYPRHRIVGIPGLSVGIAEFIPLLASSEMVLCFDQEIPGTFAWQNVETARKKIMAARRETSPLPNWNACWTTVKGMDDAKLANIEIRLRKS